MEMLYLTTHSTHFIYGYMTLNIWLYGDRYMVKDHSHKDTFYIWLYGDRYMVKDHSHKDTFYIWLYGDSYMDKDYSHRTHFIYGYMVTDVWSRTTHIGHILYMAIW